MATVTFDTLKFANQLKTAGVPSVQAEAEAKALSEVFESNLSELVTKEDLHHEMGNLEIGLRHKIKELETGLRHEIKELETGLRHEMKERELRIDTRFEKVHGEILLMKWMLGLLIAGVASLILKAFFGA
jgi:hypothetical protein